MATVTAKKLGFMAPADMLEEGVEQKLKVPVLQTAPIVGTWIADDPATRGLVKIVIAASGSTLTVHPYGACSPKPCDWGTQPAIPYAMDVSSPAAIAFSAAFKFPFKQTVLVGRILQGTLEVETFDQFTDGSGRSNYTSAAFFHK